MDTTSLQPLASAFAEALNTKNVDLFDTCIAPDYINHNPAVAPGLAGVKAFFTGWLAAFPDTQVVVEDSLTSTSGDTVVGRYTWGGLTKRKILYVKVLVPYSYRLGAQSQKPGHLLSSLITEETEVVPPFI
jgi:hypothetical protein